MNPPKCCQSCSIINFEGCWKEEKGQCDLVKPEERFVEAKETTVVTENKSPENVGIKPSDAIPNFASEQSPLSEFKSESVQAGRHRDNSCVERNDKP